MNTTIVTTSDTGFTFVRGESFAVMKNPDGGVKKVPERFVDDLLDVSDGQATVDDFPADFRRTVAELRDEGYIYEGPVVELQRPSIAIGPYLALMALLLAPYVLITAAEFDILLAVFTSVSRQPPVLIFVYGPLFMLPAVAVHEFGHYRESGKHTPVSFGIGTINGLVPAFKTYTTETWLLSRKHRIWINLSGTTYESVAALPLVAMYYFEVYPPLPHFEAVLPWLVIGFVVGTFTFVLNPFYHGDGYLVLTDVLGEWNIRKKARDAYQERTPNVYALYGFVSYGLVNVYRVVSVATTVIIWGFTIGGILIAVDVLFLLAEFSGSRAREFVSHEPEWVRNLQRRTEPASAVD